MSRAKVKHLNTERPLHEAKLRLETARHDVRRKLYELFRWGKEGRYKGVSVSWGRKDRAKWAREMRQKEAQYVEALRILNQTDGGEDGLL